MLDAMGGCGNVTSSVCAVGLDIGSTQVKAVLIAVDGSAVRELAVAEQATEGRDAAGLVACALAAMQEVLQKCDAPIAAVGIASMAETGALVDPDGTATGPLLRWDRSGDPAARLALAGDLDPAELHAATGAPLTPKLPLLTWGALASEGLPGAARWGFSADLVAAALTGWVATDHTLAGRSGAYRLPPFGDPLPTGWDAELLHAVGVPGSLPPEVLAPAEPVGTVQRALPAASGVPVHIAGHDHAVAAWVAGVGDRIVHSLGTTEAVIALAEHPVDRAAAGAQGISVVRAVDGVREGVLAGHPSAGALIADWASRAGSRAEELLAAPAPATPGPELALPYPRGRQSPAPDPEARYALLVTEPEDPEKELSAILHGLAGQGAWMRDLVNALTDGRVSIRGQSPLLNRRRVAAVGTPVRVNARLAGLMAALAGGPLELVDLAAPVATGAALLALERQGEIPHPTIPIRIVEPGPAPDGLVDRLIAATTQGAP